jgi:hypothetical protein
MKITNLKVPLCPALLDLAWLEAVAKISLWARAYQSVTVIGVPDDCSI